MKETNLYQIMKGSYIVKKSCSISILLFFILSLLSIEVSAESSGSQEMICPNGDKINCYRGGSLIKKWVCGKGEYLSVNSDRNTALQESCNKLMKMKKKEELTEEIKKEIAKEKKEELTEEVKKEIAKEKKKLENEIEELKKNIILLKEKIKDE